MKKTTKILSVVMAMVLCVAIGVGATLAWLTATTDTVTNTFTEATLVEKKDDFVLREHHADPNENGNGYHLTDQEVTENSYVVVPGVNLNKDPFVRVKPQENAWLFITVDKNLQTGMDFEMDPQWLPLMDAEHHQVKTQAGNPVYVLNKMLPKGVQENALNIIKDKTVTVQNNFTYQKGVDCNIIFNAYLSQANNVKPLQAWNDSFAAIADKPVA